MMDDQGQCDGMFDVGPNGSGRDLGDPGATPFEVGFDYCWNNDPDFGTFAEEDLTQTGSMAAGSYTTMTNLNTLIGCPLNGEWQLLIKDSYQADVGVVNSWSLFLNPDINPSTEYYSPGIVSAGWDENQDLIINDDSVSVTVAPSQEGNNAFTFFAYDEFGCRHDTTIFIYVRPDVIAGPDLIACDLMHTLTAQNAPGGGEWVMLDSPSNTSTVSYEYLLEGTANITVNEYGIYSFQITENNCGYQDESEIDFRPDPVVLPLVADTVLCVGGSFILDAGPQEDNSDNFNINWTRNNTTFNAEDYAVLVDQTGQYIITITGVCGTASDTSNIVAIELLFEGDTLCGLETLQPVNVELSPEGNGVWTSTAENITFSDPTGLSTFITSSQYGGFPVMFTDSRCPDDGLELNFQFVEQPTVEVLPQNPEFCLELDSLIITTNVSGNNTGDFFWNISGEGSQPVFSQNDSLFFGPESFLPLEVYTVQVQIFDNFGVCNVASGSMTFDGLWCTYTIPNVITPNGDGQNDRFMIEFMEYFPGTQLTIFNRWGNVVFDQSNYDQYQVMNNGWDPEDLSAGVYFYELKVPQVREVVSGNLTIIR
jgi:gliding motility-associated-like protein